MAGTETGNMQNVSRLSRETFSFSKLQTWRRCEILLFLKTLISAIGEVYVRGNYVHSSLIFHTWLKQKAMTDLQSGKKFA